MGPRLETIAAIDGHLLTGRSNKMNERWAMASIRDRSLLGTKSSSMMRRTRSYSVFRQTGAQSCELCLVSCERFARIENDRTSERDRESKSLLS